MRSYYDRIGCELLEDGGDDDERTHVLAVNVPADCDEKRR